MDLLTFVDEDLDLAEAEVLLVFAVVPQVHKLAAVTLVLVAVEERLLILKYRIKFSIFHGYFNCVLQAKLIISGNICVMNRDSRNP